MSQTRSPWPSPPPPSAPGSVDAPPLVPPPAQWYDRQPLLSSWPLPIRPARRRLLNWILSALLVAGVVVAAMIVADPFSRDENLATQLPTGAAIRVGPMAFTPTAAHWSLPSDGTSHLSVVGTCQLLEPPIVDSPTELLSGATRASWFTASGQGPVLDRPVVSFLDIESGSAPREEPALGMPPVGCRLSFVTDVPSEFLPGQVVIQVQELAFKPSDGVSTSNRWAFVGRARVMSLPATIQG